MSSSQNIAARDHSSDPAPTPQNTPLDTKVLASRPADVGKPKVEDIGEDEDEEEDVSGFNPASLLAQVSNVCNQWLILVEPRPSRARAKQAWIVGRPIFGLH